MDSTTAAPSLEPVLADIASKSVTPDPIPNAASSMQPEHDAKLVSPPPMSTSITPPPSSQLRVNRPPVVRRTPTPPTPHLSSPPPTLKEAAQLGSLGTGTDIPSADRVATADSDELRSMVNELCAALREARLSTAHYKLQFNMLSMESQEAANRMSVELAMAQREVEVYQEADARRRTESVTPGQQDPGVANAALLHEMSRHCSLLQQENEELQDRLAQTQRTLESREGEMSTLLEKNEQLRERIRKNREHMNGFLDYVHERSPQSLTSTPHQATPRSRPNFRAAPQHSSSQGGLIDTLLLADKVLNSQETATAPSTPARARKLGHRVVHSMSSLPTTPQRSRPITASTLQTPPSFAPINEAPRTIPGALYPTQRRRPSSDSTVTASSVDDDVPESQASQAATSMLRRTPKKSAAPSLNASFGSNSGSQSKLKQTKLFGQITKPGMHMASPEHEKRRLSDVGNQMSPAKRARLREGVGLGIGLDAPRV